MVRALSLVLKLARLKMTVFSAVTYGTAASVANLALVEAGLASEFDAGLFLAGWAFVFFTQLVAHFLGEYYDLPSDKLNHYAGPLTGGSKVLVCGDITPGQCLTLGYACAAAAGSILAFVLPRRCLVVGTALMFIAHQYSALPFSCNHRGLGELTASLASNVLLPQFAALVQSDTFQTPAPRLFHGSLAALVVPAFCLKMGLFLALNMADRRPDWLGSKYTLPVVLGDETCSRMLGAFNVLAYLSAICIFLAGLCPATTLAAVLLSAPEAMAIARAFNPSWTTWRPPFWATSTSSSKGRNDQAGIAEDPPRQQQRPYRLEGLVVRILKHAPGVVLAIFADAMLREANAAGKAAAAAAAAAAAEAGGGGAASFSYLDSWISGVAGVLLSTSLLVRCLPLLPFVYLFLSRPPPGAPPAHSAATSTAAESTVVTASSPAGGPKKKAGVVVAGGGVGGLVLGACLQELGLPFEILEKSPSGADSDGADLALWPSAAKILKELGVGSADPADGDEFVDLSDFWRRKTYPVRTVRICKMDNKSKPSSGEDLLPLAAAADGGVSSESGRVSVAGDGRQLRAAAAETLLTKVDMDAVVDGEGEPFRLVGRRAVMSALLPLVDKGSVRRGVLLSRAEQSVPPGETTATAHIIGAGTARGDGGGTGGTAERVTCRVLVGADGIHSVCRSEVAAAATFSKLLDEGGCGADSSTSPSGENPGSAAAAATAVRASRARDGGEVCFRGVLDLKAESAATKAGLRAMFEEDEEKRPESMSVVYGDRIRFSWGFIDGAHETGYWFVKQLTENGRRQSGDGDGKDWGKESLPASEGWPEPLKTFAKMTGAECSYEHRIQDRPPLDRWSSGNITLLGDACHPATPNNGQGACMAIEDALVLATLLAEYWEERDGHVEAFYLYERARLAHTRSVQGESLKQMKLGQLTSRTGIWLRDLVISSLPPSLLQKKLRAANVFDIDPWLARFRSLKAKRQQG